MGRMNRSGRTIRLRRTSGSNMLGLCIQAAGGALPVTVEAVEKGILYFLRAADCSIAPCESLGSAGCSDWHRTASPHF